jgi:hypothetical protein
MDDRQRVDAALSSLSVSRTALTGQPPIGTTE